MVLSRFSDVRPWESGFLSPFHERYGGVKFYRFLAGAYVVYIKVDRRPALDPLAGLVLRPDAQLLIVAREFHGGSEYRAFHRIARARRRGEEEALAREPAMIKSARLN